MQLKIEKMSQTRGDEAERAAAAPGLWSPPVGGCRYCSPATLSSSFTEVFKTHHPSLHLNDGKLAASSGAFLQTMLFYSVPNNVGSSLSTLPPGGETAELHQVKKKPVKIKNKECKLSIQTGSES